MDFQSCGQRLGFHANPTIDGKGEQEAEPPTNPQVPLGKNVWFKPSAKRLVQIPFSVWFSRKLNLNITNARIIIESLDHVSSI